MVAFDEIRAGFKLDPTGEDLADDGDGTNNSCADAGGCDGIAEDMLCSVTIARRETAGRRTAQPFTIGIDLAANETCTTTVFAAYDNPAGMHNKSAKGRKPTGCDLVVEGDPGVFDTLALNEGIKVFGTISGELLIGPQDSIQLAGGNCERSYEPAPADASEETRRELRKLNEEHEHKIAKHEEELQLDLTKAEDEFQREATKENTAEKIREKRENIEGKVDEAYAKFEEKVDEENERFDEERDKILSKS